MNDNVQGAPTSRPPKTLGECRVRTDFNVSGSSYVDLLKQHGAKLMDDINITVSKSEWSEETVSEFRRLKALALTNIEQGVMWAVKMATL